MYDPVLVLNANFEPIHVCTTRRAIGLILTGKASLVLNGRGEIKTVTRIYPRPSIIRLDKMIRRPRPTIRLTKREILRRDDFTCQYCGQHTIHLTIDHVIPRRLGGKHTWENLVSACALCNRRKAGRTPEQAHMKLYKVPVRPAATIYQNIPYHFLETQSHWLKYLPQPAG